MPVDSDNCWLWWYCLLIGTTKIKPPSHQSYRHLLWDEQWCSIVKDHNFTVHGWLLSASSVPDEVKSFYKKHFDFTTSFNGCLLLGFKVVIAKKYQSSVLELLHERHPHMKSLAQLHVWWPSINTDIEQTAQISYVQICALRQRIQPKSYYTHGISHGSAYIWTTLVLSEEKMVSCHWYLTTVSRLRFMLCIPPQYKQQFITLQDIFCTWPSRAALNRQWSSICDSSILWASQWNKWPKDKLYSVVLRTNLYQNNRFMFRQRSTLLPEKCQLQLLAQTHVAKYSTCTNKAFSSTYKSFNLYFGCCVSIYLFLY